VTQRTPHETLPDWWTESGWMFRRAIGDSFAKRAAQVLSHGMGDEE
jgi:hypothetical protein